MDHYEIMEQIGRGAFGAAILAHHKSEKEKVHEWHRSYDIHPPPFTAIFGHMQDRH